MDEKYYSLIEMAFTLMVVFGIGLWELRSVNRAIADDKRARESADEGPGESGDPRHSVGQHPLDDR